MVRRVGTWVRPKDGVEFKLFRVAGVDLVPWLDTVEIEIHNPKRFHGISHIKVATFMGLARGFLGFGRKALFGFVGSAASGPGIVVLPGQSHRYADDGEHLLIQTDPTGNILELWDERAVTITHIQRNA